MKQLVFMIVLTAMGTVGAVYSPFWSVAVYYLFAVLRPQFMWAWSLPPGVPWSQFVAGAAIVSAGIAWLGQGRALSRAHLWMLAFGGWVCITALTAGYFHLAEPWLWEYLKIVVMYACAAVLVQRVNQLRWLVLLATAALGYIAYEVNFLYLVNGRLDIYHRGYGGLDNNGAALMLAMGVPCCFYLWDRGHTIWRWGWLALVPLILHAVMMSYSRGAMLSLVAASPLLLFRTRHRAWLAPVLGLLVLVGVPMMAGQEIRARFFSIQEYDVDASANSRFDSWRAAYLIAMDHPVFGVGVRNSNLYTQQYGADMHGRTVHNQYLQIAADSGFVGMGLYLMVLASTWWSIRQCRRRLWGRDDAEAEQGLLVCNIVEGAMAVFCIGGLFLSLEVFELPFLLLLCGAQLPLVLGDAPEPAELAAPDEPPLYASHYATNH